MKKGTKEDIKNFAMGFGLAIAIPAGSLAFAALAINWPYFFFTFLGLVFCTTIGWVVMDEGRNSRGNK